MDDHLFERIKSVSSVWRPTSTGFPVASHDDQGLPPEYLDLLQALGPGEGFIGAQYVRLYPVGEIAAANGAYAIQKYLPSHLLFGSDGCGNAFLFDLSSPDRPVVVQPFIPLDLDYAEASYPNWSTFLQAMLSVPDGFQPLVANPETHGRELHERHPVVLGGDPTEPGNKVMLPPPTHAEACTFFNQVVKSVRPQR